MKAHNLRIACNQAFYSPCVCFGSLCCARDLSKAKNRECGSKPGTEELMQSQRQRTQLEKHGNMAALSVHSVKKLLTESGLELLTIEAKHRQRQRVA